jgi:hypothetical protein
MDYDAFAARLGREIAFVTDATDFFAQAEGEQYFGGGRNQRDDAHDRFNLEK